MAPHLPLPISGGRCGDNGDATSDPVGVPLIGEGWSERLDGQGPHRAACQRTPRSPLRSARHSGMFGSLHRPREQKRFVHVPPLASYLPSKKEQGHPQR
jgi:hypothetical protein